jgi:hypothetical protein
MPLIPPNIPTPPNNPSESFAWLHDFIATIPRIVGGNHNGFGCEPYLRKPCVVNGIVYQEGRGPGPAGIHTNGTYWVGFYYKLWNNQYPNAKALPWFGCGFNDEFTIDICVHPIQNQTVGTRQLFNYLRDHLHSTGNHATLQKPFCSQQEQMGYYVRCRFHDYMRMGFGSRVPDPNFSLSNWICSSQTQEKDLSDFFETINAKFLVPHI